MNILILGSGGREHAIAWKANGSKLSDKIFVAPGNAGTNEIAINVSMSVNDFDDIFEFIIKESIDLLIIGPEDPLVNGLTDFLKSKNSTKDLIIIGPGKSGAHLEGSKDFAKEFMKKYDIPTAKYFTATSLNISEAISFLQAVKAPYVLKADGLAAGKGVLILDDFDEAVRELKEMLQGKFGTASSKVVIEEFLKGVECSVFAVTDGKSYVVLPEAKDYKRIGENDTGLNTGGMGALSPVPFYDKDFKAKVEERIIKPTIKGIDKEGMDYTGFVFFGLINVEGNPFVIEYNVRMGDPETEVVLPRLKTDFIEILIAAGKNKLDDIIIEFEENAAATVMLVSGGYPEAYKKGEPISGYKTIKDSIVFHAGTKNENGKVLSAGGRVMAITSYGKSVFDALNQSYLSAEKIEFNNMYYRKDLGFDLK